VVVGGFLLAIALAVYLLVVLTGCLTIDYARPVFKRSKPKLFVANIVVLFLLLMGATCLAYATLLVPFKLLGLPLSPWVVALVGTALVVNIVSIRVNIWAPLERRLVKQRQRALGTPEPEIAIGMCLGISDPAVSGWKRAVMEDDVGMVWLEPDQLVYRGDADGFSCSRAQLAAIERVAAAGSASAYAGNRHIVLRITGEGGQERRVRLHVEGEWTLGRMREATDRLADRLSAWRDGAAPGRAAPGSIY
jgi:hypothetical protein